MELPVQGPKPKIPELIGAGSPGAQIDVAKPDILIFKYRGRRVYLSSSYLRRLTVDYTVPDWLRESLPYSVTNFPVRRSLHCHTQKQGFAYSPVMIESS